MNRSYLSKKMGNRVALENLKNAPKLIQNNYPKLKHN